MTQRYDLLIASMQEAARTVTILFGFAWCVLLTRWSIRFMPEKMRPFFVTTFDLWIVAVNLFMFIVSK